MLVIITIITNYYYYTYTYTYIDSFQDLLLSDNILLLLKIKSQETLSDDIKALYSKVATKAAIIWNQLAQLISQESVQYLEIILEICKISRDYQNQPLIFAEKMDLIKPYFDTKLLSYLRYAISEEEMKIKNYGKDPILTPSNWLQILNIVYNGISYELEMRFQRIIDPLIQILRFDQPDIRTQLFLSIIKTMPTLDLPYLRTCAENMVDYTLFKLNTSELSDSSLLDKMEHFAKDIQVI